MSTSVFVQALDALNRSGGRYVAVGGVATVIHGVQRLTADLDIIIDFAERNCQKIIESLSSLGFSPNVPVSIADICDGSIRERWVSEKNAVVVSLRSSVYPAFAVDVFLRSPIPFDELFRDSQLMLLSGVSVRICSRAHLIQLKKIAGRPRDIEDIENLERIAAKSRNG